MTSTTAGVRTLTTYLFISAEELAKYCISSRDELPPPTPPTDRLMQHVNPREDPHLTESEIQERCFYEECLHWHQISVYVLGRVKVKLVKLYASVLEEAHGRVSTVMLMEHVRDELEELHRATRFFGCVEFMFERADLDMGCNRLEDRIELRLGQDIIADTLLDNRFGSFLLVRAYWRVGLIPDTDLVAVHDELTDLIVGYSDSKHRVILYWRTILEELYGTLSRLSAEHDNDI